MIDTTALDQRASRTVTVNTPTELYETAIRDVGGITPSDARQGIKKSGHIPVTLTEARLQVYVRPWVIHESIESDQTMSDDFIRAVSSYVTLTNPTNDVPDSVGYVHDIVDDEVVEIVIDRQL